MKNLTRILTIVIALNLSQKVMAQTTVEQTIRTLETQETQAVLKGDMTTLLEKLWAPELIVNNPANIVISRKDIVELIKSGKINYEAFERIIEKISVVGNTAIVMGREVIKPQGVTDNAGKDVVRRFTNVWMNRDHTWKLVGRQATIASVR